MAADHNGKMLFAFGHGWGLYVASALESFKKTCGAVTCCLYVLQLYTPVYMLMPSIFLRPPPPPYGRSNGLFLRRDLRRAIGHSGCWEAIVSESEAAESG